MPRKSITGPHRKRTSGSWREEKERLHLLFIEDGDDEMERFTKVLKSAFEYHHVVSGREVHPYLKEHPEIDIIYLTMDFPSIPEDELLGAEDIIFERFNDDEEKAIEFLRENQGAFILHHIRNKVKKPIPILFSYDFSSELQRWDTLTSRYENVYYCKSEMSPIDVADLIQTIIQKSRPESL